MHPFGDIGLWASSSRRVVQARRPALFLDRDGVVVEEVHFLRRPQDVRMMPGIPAALAVANAAGVPVVVVTNQSGIARGHFGWADFMAVQDAIAAALAAAGAWCDAVFACGKLDGAPPPFGEDVHGWRKPAPGMLLAARDGLDLDLARSTIVGDRVSDLEAGQKAGLRSGTLVLTGYGAEHVGALGERQTAWQEIGYQTRVVESPATAIQSALAELT